MAKEIWEPRNSENMVRAQYESSCVWTYPVSLSHIITSHHSTSCVNTFIPWVERLKIGFAKKATVCSLHQVHVHEVGWRVSAGHRFHAVGGATFLSRASTSIVQKVKLQQVWDWLTSLGLSQERFFAANAVLIGITKFVKSQTKPRKIINHYHQHGTRCTKF